MKLKLPIDVPDVTNKLMTSDLTLYHIASNRIAKGGGTWIKIFLMENISS